MQSSAASRFAPVSDEVSAILTVVASAPTVTLALTLLDELAKWHRRILTYFRYYDQRWETREEILACYRTLPMQLLPRAIQDRVQEIIYDLSLIPIGPYSEYPRVPSELNFNGPGAAQR